MYIMKSKSTSRAVSTAHATRIGTAEFRRHLAKYLEAANAGRPVVIQGRGRNAYLLLKVEDERPASVFGCMRERTDYAAGTVVNATEEWKSGEMP